jgi:hypothetical protein
MAEEPSAEPTEEPSEEPGPAPGGEAPSEEQLRAQLDAELKRLRVEEVVIQSAASIINLTARRIAKEDERDLAQAQVGIEAIRALLPVLPEQVQTQIRDALSELQMLYAREAGGGAPPEGGESQGPAAEQAAPPPPSQPQRPPGGREPPPKLWTPPGSE